MTYAIGADADRAKALVDKQARDRRGRPLPWPSERADGTVIEGSVGTTSIQDVEIDEQTREKRYLLTDNASIHIADAREPTRSNLTTDERAELDAMATTYDLDRDGGEADAPVGRSR